MSPQLEKRKTVSEIPGPQNREQIAALAYRFWQARGCPEGTADEDWFRAERELARSKNLDRNDEENRDFAEGSIDDGEADPPVLRFPVRSEISRASYGMTSKKA